MCSILCIRWQAWSRMSISGAENKKVRDHLRQTTGKQPDYAPYPRDTSFSFSPLPNRKYKTSWTLSLYKREQVDVNGAVETTVMRKINKITFGVRFRTTRSCTTDSFVGLCFSISAVKLHCTARGPASLWQVPMSNDCSRCWLSLSMPCPALVE